MDAGWLHWLTRHETIVAFAVAGGAFSLASGIAGATRGRAARAAVWCNAAAYAFMAGSVLLFIVAGLR